MLREGSVDGLPGRGNLPGNSAWLMDAAQTRRFSAGPGAKARLEGLARDHRRAPH